MRRNGLVCRDEARVASGFAQQAPSLRITLTHDRNIFSADAQSCEEGTTLKVLRTIT